jgi:hypothetical protein
VISKLANYPQLNQIYFVTKGISFVADKRDSSNIRYADTAGSSTPVNTAIRGAVADHMAISDLLGETIMHLADLFIIVVGDLTYHDQEHIMAVEKQIQERKLIHSEGAPSVVIIHNLKDHEYHKTDPKDGSKSSLDHHIERFMEVYPNVSAVPKSVSGDVKMFHRTLPPKKLESILEDDFDSTKAKQLLLYHVFVVRDEGAGKIYNEEAFERIHTLFGMVETPQKRDIFYDTWHNLERSLRRRYLTYSVPPPDPKEIQMEQYRLGFKLEKGTNASALVAKVVVLETDHTFVLIDIKPVSIRAQYEGRNPMISAFLRKDDIELWIQMEVPGLQSLNDIHRQINTDPSGLVIQAQLRHTPIENTLVDQTVATAIRFRDKHIISRQVEAFVPIIKGFYPVPSMMEEWIDNGIYTLRLGNGKKIKGSSFKTWKYKSNPPQKEYLMDGANCVWNIGDNRCQDPIVMDIDDLLVKPDFYKLLCFNI